MTGTDAVLAVPSSSQSRRRRRAEPHQQQKEQQQQQQQSVTVTTQTHYRDDNDNSSQQYYDDSDDDANEKDHSHRHDDERIFKGSCSFGKFVLNPCLCLFNAIISCIQRWRWRFRRKIKIKSGTGPGGGGKQTSITPLLLDLLLLLFATTTLLSMTGLLSLHIRRFLSFSSSSTSSGRPLTDEIVNQIPVTITIFEFDGVDIGGWSHLRRFFRPTASLNSSLMDEPDFGGLSMLQKRNIDVAETDSKQKQKQKQLQLSSSLHSTKVLSPPRSIHPEDEQLSMEYWEELNLDDPHLHSYDHHPEELEDRDLTCHQTNWAKRYYPACNSIHEIGLVQDYDSKRANKPGYDQAFDSFYINHGHYRDVWVIHQPVPEDVKTVLKMSRWKHAYEPRTYWNTLADAMVMERLTASPRIVDIYGHCGTAVWVEAIPNEVEEVIIHGEGMAKQEDLHDELELKPLNDYTVEEKLEMALAMAESLADLHGFRDGVIVHDDVQLCQWLRTKDGRLKLGDFNRAEVMDYDLKKKQYCRYYNGDCYGNYRSPEEYTPTNLNEAIDVFSFGNNIYALLTGLWVFYDTDDDSVVQTTVINGTRAFIDPRWKKRSYIESKLVEVMELCWIQDTTKRIDIFQAVQRLRETTKEHESRKTKKRGN